MDIFTQKKLLVRIVIILLLINISAIGIFLWMGADRRVHPVQRMQDSQIADGDQARVPDSTEKNRRDEYFESGGIKGASGSNDDHCDVSRILEHELDLTGKQAEQIRNIRESFFDKEKILEAIIRSERDSMNIQMFNINTNEEQLKQLAFSVSQNEYKMELLRIEQAKQLKSICTPKQLEKFSSLVKEIRDYFRPENRTNKRPPPRE